MARMNSDRPLFVIGGGGTGGHLYPGMVVAEDLRALLPGLDICVFGTRREMDAKLTSAKGYELVPQNVLPMTNKPWKWPAFLKAWVSSVSSAKRRFAARRPAAVLGLGGYAAGPPIVAAAKLGIPTAIFNPDAVPGRANRRLASRVDRVFVQWEQTAACFPEKCDVLCTGCPIRPDFAVATRNRGCRALKLDPDRPTLLITGASQGAHSINATVVELLDVFKSENDWQIVHLTGHADLEWCRKKYAEHQIAARVYAYTEHMAYCMAVADLIISRAGASTLAEITAMGVPSILMPYPFDRRQHQLANAQILVSQGAAVRMEDANDAKANARRLRDELRSLMRSDESRRRMARSARALGKPDAGEVIAQSLVDLIQSRD